ncbi:hypothetical protein JCM19237_1079 [Photobacterium aphoticum]|uniref:ExoP galactose-binding-like domain-containing protein n=1 Tax=Photobacterium aphoticum TaxID=754436 RepID=A0A090R9Y2_9GAMM|nr:hypothetical protein JCM19237_1079 [Photobacterium aphoticum]
MDMEININKKALIVSGLSLSLLAGCLDDPYHYPEEEVVPPPPSNTSKIYGPESDGTFALSVIDKDALQAPINTEGFVSQGNVSTSNISGQTQGNLNLRITESAAARLVAHSSNSANLDMDIADPATSTLQFALRVMDKPAVDQDIYLTTQREDGIDLGKVSLTSAVMAYTGAAPQTVKVPLSCFTDAGMDYSDTLAPFVLHSSSNLNVDIGDIRVVTNSVEEDHVLACHTASTLVKPDGDTNVSKMFVIDAPDGQGWASALYMDDGRQ